MDRPPQRLGPYEIRHRLGSGGMGVVYRAWDDRLGRQVAVKTLLPSLTADPNARRRFLQEARTAAAVSHPNVTQIHDIGEDGATVFFAMECLEGSSLQTLLAEHGPIAPARAVDWIRQAACGLGAAAERGIVHRDVKPSNLFVTTDGTVKVTDFGLAREIISDNRLTQDGQMIGTPNYVSPEQANGSRLDLRSDIYSLGVTFYELVAGRPPFQGPSAVAVLLQHVREPVPPLREIAPTVPRSVATLIQRMLSKAPAARPQSYDELIVGLDRIAEELRGPLRKSTEPRRLPEPRPRPSRGSARRWLGYAAATAVVGALIGLAYGWVPHRAPAPAETSAPDAAAPRLRFAPAAEPAVEVAPAELRVVRTGHEITEHGLFRVHGEVQNVGSATASAVTVRVVLARPEDGESLDAQEVPVSPSRLSAGEQGSFEALFPNPARKVDLLIELNWDSLVGPPAPSPPGRG